MIYHDHPDHMDDDPLAELHRLMELAESERVSKARWAYGGVCGALLIMAYLIAYFSN